MTSLTFTTIDGTEPYCVVDLDTGGYAWFHELNGTRGAYRYMAYVKDVLGHNARLEILK